MDWGDCVSQWRLSRPTFNIQHSAFCIKCLVNMNTRIITTQCPHCHQSRPWTQADRLVWLHQSGFLRKHKDPVDEIVQEMFRLKLAELPCPNCHKPGVKIVPTVQAVEDNDDEWDTTGGGEGSAAAAKYCVDCREQIDPERVELFRDVTRCIDCQRRFENGEQSGKSAVFSADDLCPRCGDFLQTHRNRSSRTAYRVQCQGCGYSPKR